jgi:glutathione peroxidase
MVIGVHENDFGGQGGDEGELAAQCEIYSVDFPQMQMVKTVGPDSDPFYAWVRERTGKENFPGWNFNKVLIGADGEIVSTFGSGTLLRRARVQSALVTDIETALGGS